MRDNLPDEKLVMIIHCFFGGKLYRKSNCRSRKKNHNICGIKLAGGKCFFREVGIADGLVQDCTILFLSCNEEKNLAIEGY